DVRPAELGPGGAADRRHERLGGGVGEAGHGGAGVVVDDDLGQPAVREDLPDVGDGLLLGAVGGVPVVDDDGAGVRDDVGGDAALDADRVEPFVVLQAVNDRAAGLVRRQLRQDRG